MAHYKVINIIWKKSSREVMLRLKEVADLNGWGSVKILTREWNLSKNVKEDNKPYDSLEEECYSHRKQYQ